MKVFFLFFVITFLFSSGYSEEKGGAKTVKLDKAIKGFSEGERLSLCFISVSDQQVVYEHNSDTLFCAWGINKLFTAAAALKCLGPDFTFKTRMFSSTLIEEGRLAGDLIISGSGDPTFTSYDLEEMFEYLKLKDCTKIEGDIILDVSEFDQLRFSPGWMWKKESHCTMAPCEAFALDEGCLSLWIKKRSRNRPEIILSKEGSLGSLHIENQIIFDDNPIKQNHIECIITPVENKISFKGNFSSNSELVNCSMYLKNSAEYVSHRVEEFLKKYSITLNGKIVIRQGFKGSHLLYTHSSEPLSIITQKMIKKDRAHYANALLKKLGRVKYGKPGSWTSGAQAIRDFLYKHLKDEINQVILVDGSGDSLYNKVSAHAVAKFLCHMATSYKYAPEFLSSLCLAGYEGCLKKRGKEKPLCGLLRGERMQQGDTTLFYGYLPTQQGSMLAFCLMAKNSHSLDRRHQEAFEDMIFQIVRDE